MVLRFFKNLTIRRKLLVLLLLVITLFVLFTSFSFYVYKEINGLVNKVNAYRDIQDMAKIGKNLQLHVLYVWQFITEASLTKNQLVIEEKAQQYVELANKDIEDLIMLSGDEPEHVTMLNSIKADIPVQWDLGNKMFKAYLADGQKGNVLTAEFNKFSDKLIQETAVIVTRLDGMGARGVKEMFNRMKTTSMITAVSAAFLFVASIGIMLLIMNLKRSIMKPVSEIQLTADQMASGDLTIRVDVKGRDEMASLGLAINKITTNLKDMLLKVRSITNSVSSVTENIASSSGKVLSGANMQQSAIESAAGFIDEIDNSISSVSIAANNLASSSERASSSVIEMASSIENVAESANVFSINASEAASSIEEMVASIKEIAESLELISASSEETAASITEINAAVKEVEMSAIESVSLAEKVTAEASEKGMKAANAAINGMEEIKTSVGAIAEVINRLGKRSEEIGKILNVIADVADDTNLLALNAAILAAQAGVHGKGFAVVADEIRNLAEKTSFSTGEIEALIRSVQAETKASVDLARTGINSVEKGVTLVKEVNIALTSILDISKPATEKARFIQRAATEQSHVIKGITEAIKSISEQIEHISKATREQSTGSRQIIESIERIKELSRHVRNATNEQSIGSRQISETIGNVSRQAEQIAGATSKQQERSKEIVKTIENIKKIAGESVGIASTMNLAIRSLEEESRTLLAELQRFKV
ncbi:MAG: methyl-accepting chemotaxis protein [Nitrospirota bacterium]|nr:methyl-accepting chemotaxis protein [Nitrospirota bacterium]